ncbi:deoxyribonuclease IV [Candidatus Daviesbacteria bacterium]|nr:deoxyribonuclease IV [Candidatus Daviesbacteria bacterium]
MPKVGAHVSASVSLELAFQRAKQINADCFQIFISPPQQWLKTRHPEDEVSAFLKAQKESGISPNFIHGTYLINLGTQNKEHLKKSIDWLIYALNLAKDLEMQGVIFHLGSHKGVGFEAIKEQVIKSLGLILKEVRGDGERGAPSSARSAVRTSDGAADRQDPKRFKQPQLILETSAGAGGNLGGNFRELGEILKQVDNPRLKICLDTQHVFASGYDVKSVLGLKDVLEEFEQEIGLENLAVIHANDSKVEYRSNRDRHENIGEGFIGKEGFSNLINHPKLKDIPFILEVPGFAGNGPDLENVQLLKSLVDK